jgi:hypothetical protein
MSDFTAIKGVSSTLKTLIMDRIQSPNNITVTIAAPDVSIEGLIGTRVNLFLYRVTENASLKNQEIPGVGYPADYGHPPLSLDLHYLLTILGGNENDESTVQQVLGDVMRILHDYSIITEGLLKKNPPNDMILDVSLRDQFEKVKISLDPMNLEDITKIWTALTKPYRLSVAYNVSVVQIESNLERPIKRLVGEPQARGPKVYAVPFTSPRIEKVRVIRKGDLSKIEKENPFASIGDTLVLIGSNFQDDSSIKVILGPDGGSVIFQNLTNERIELEIPDVIINDENEEIRLQPGPKIVEVARKIKMGEPPVDHVGLRSNQAPFMLVPGINDLKPDPKPPQAPTTLRIEGSRLYNPDKEKESMALIDNALIPVADYSVRQPDVLAFKLPVGLKKGDHAVRVRVNGAENIDKYMRIP